MDAWIDRSLYSLNEGWILVFWSIINAAAILLHVYGRVCFSCSLGCVAALATHPILTPEGFEFAGLFNILFLRQFP